MTKSKAAGQQKGRSKDARVVGILKYLGAESPVVVQPEDEVPELTFLSPAQQSLKARQAESGAPQDLFAPPAPP